MKDNINLSEIKKQLGLFFQLNHTFYLKYIIITIKLSVVKKLTNKLYIVKYI